MTGITIRRFQKPDEARVFDKGKFELIRIGGLTGRSRARLPAGSSTSVWSYRGGRWS